MRKYLFLLFIFITSAAFAEPALTLAQANRFESSRVGIAGTASANYLAFQTELAKGKKAIPVFEKLLVDGTPAAKLYSAVGLYSLDKPKGMAALRKLKSDKSEIETMSGCMMSKTTVGSLVETMLANNAEGLEIYVPRSSK